MIPYATFTRYYLELYAIKLELNENHKCVYQSDGKCRKGKTKDSFVVLLNDVDDYIISYRYRKQIRRRRVRFED
ncbi:hypothetical protein EmuJ_000526600 [Echinococcus multilocularis]|uniref:Uncharacterized protein n=1 Tax=Echinococcus multilocularis TaxID=6211 RepID=A0A068Y4A0_ECHMU|nr:hypothetical protein EmuJ_000526600 [Echinococcus multilocularis]